LNCWLYVSVHVACWCHVWHQLSCFQGTKQHPTHWWRPDGRFLPHLPLLHFNCLHVFQLIYLLILFDLPKKNFFLNLNGILQQYNFTLGINKVLLKWTELSGCCISHLGKAGDQTGQEEEFVIQFECCLDWWTYIWMIWSVEGSRLMCEYFCCQIRVSCWDTNRPPAMLVWKLLI